jgi:hypothetical protein
MPSEKQAVVDLRAQLSFRVTNAALDPASLRLSVDGLDMGPVSSYLEGQQSLRVLPGNHLVRVVFSSGGQLVFEERLFIGEGVSKVLLIN